MINREKKIAKIMLEEELTNIFNCYQTFIDNTKNRLFHAISYEDEIFVFKFMFYNYCHLFGLNYKYLKDKHPDLAKMRSYNILMWLLDHKSWLVNEIIDGNIDKSILLNQTAYDKILELSKIADFKHSQLHYFINVDQELYKKYNATNCRIKAPFLIGIRNDEAYTLFTVTSDQEKNKNFAQSLLCYNPHDLCSAQIMHPIKALKVEKYMDDTMYYGSSYEDTIIKLNEMKVFAGLNNSEVLNGKNIRLTATQKLAIINENKESSIQRKRSVN